VVLVYGSHPELRPAVSALWPWGGDRRERVRLMPPGGIRVRGSSG
jgi:hypothetical protein